MISEMRVWLVVRWWGEEMVKVWSQAVGLDWVGAVDRGEASGCSKAATKPIKSNNKTGAQKGDLAL